MTKTYFSDPTNIFPQPFSTFTQETFSSCELCFSMVELSELSKRMEHHSFLSFWLNSEECETISSFTHYKRKHEWLGGRICAKRAISNLLPIENCTPHEIFIGNRDDGKPYFTPADTHATDQPPDISISHGTGYACAMAASSFCGIDIQWPKDTLERVYDRYCTSAEEMVLDSLMPQRKRLHKLAIIWAAKEAIRKAMSHKHIPGFLSVELCHGNLSDDCVELIFTEQTTKFRVAATLFNGYGLAVCLIEGDTHA